jgi:hypothetical protein
LTLLAVLAGSELAVYTFAALTSGVVVHLSSSAARTATGKQSTRNLAAQVAIPCVGMRRALSLASERRRLLYVSSLRGFDVYEGRKRANI